MDAIALSGLIIGSLALLISCIGLSIIVGVKNSTHRVEWMPLESPSGSGEEKSAPPFYKHQDLDDNYLKDFAKMHDNFENEQV